MNKHEKKFCVYIHVFPNNKVYIGITSKKPEYRWGRDGIGYTSKIIKNAIKKYGWDNVEHYILETGISKQDACDLEIKLIKSNRSNEIKFGYNNSIGGEYGCLGYKHTEESKRKISIINKGKKFSQEHRKKMSIAHSKGFFKQYQSFYEKRKKTMKERYPDGHCEPVPIHYVLQMDLDNNIIAVWDNIAQAERKLRIRCGIRNCCNFKCITAKGFKFRYAEDFDKQYISSRRVSL